MTASTLRMLLAECGSPRTLEVTQADVDLVRWLSDRADALADLIDAAEKIEEPGGLIDLRAALAAFAEARLDAGSSSGRTPGSGPGNEGSIPSPAVDSERTGECEDAADPITTEGAGDTPASGSLWAKIQDQQARIRKLEQKYATVKGDLYVKQQRGDRLAAAVLRTFKCERDEIVYYGPDAARELYALAASQEQTRTHGRGCPCTPCQAEDWDAIDAGIRRWA